MAQALHFQVLSNLDSRVEASDQRMTNDAPWIHQTAEDLPTFRWPPVPRG
jgi:hypothetical protein